MPEPVRGTSAPDRPASEQGAGRGLYAPWLDRPVRWPSMYRFTALFFVGYPLVALVSSHPDALEAALALSATAIFLGLLWVGWRTPAYDPARRSRLPVAGVLAILVMAVILVIHGHQGWLVFFYYASTGASPLLPPRRTFALMSLSGIVAGATLFGLDGDLANAVIQAVSVNVIGLLIFSVNETRRTNRALLEARHESRAWPSPTRGHASPATCTTPSATACRSSPSRASSRAPPAPRCCARGHRDRRRRARLARGARVRARDGQRLPAADARGRAGRCSTDARGGGHPDHIDADVQRLPPAVDAVLAWTVREAVMNVVRHSGDPQSAFGWVGMATGRRRTSWMTAEAWRRSTRSPVGLMARVPASADRAWPGSPSG